MRTYLYGLMVAAAIAVHPASAQVICGATITTKQTMTADLTCVENPAITVDGGSVDMAGHTLNVNASADGFLLTGKGSKLFNGTISGSSAENAVVLDGEGKHQLSNLRISGFVNATISTIGGNKVKNCSIDGGTLRLALGQNLVTGNTVNSGKISLTGGSTLVSDNVVVAAPSFADGLYISGNNNTVKRNVVVSSDSGIRISGSFNKILENTAAHNAQVGLAANGDSNKLIKNVSMDNGDVGIWVTGFSNSVTLAKSTDNSSAGIYVTGQGNKVTGCRAFANGGHGIVTFGDADQLSANLVMQNGSYGINLDGSTNTSVKNNFATGNGQPDMRDATSNCGNNLWTNNVFGTSDANGTASPSCID